VIRCLLVLASLALVVVGCAPAPRKPADDPQQRWQARQQQLRGFDRWRAEGRLSIDRGGDGRQAYFAWHQRGERFRLRLTGPWGQGVGVIEAGPSGAQLDLGDGERYRGPDARRVLASVYGWDIPVSGLRYWLVGLARDGAKPALDRFGRLARLEWQGWRIEYEAYREVAGVELPSRLRARRGDAVEIRVAIHDWALPGASGDGDSDAPDPASDGPMMGG